MHACSSSDVRPDSAVHSKQPANDAYLPAMPFGQDFLIGIRWSWLATSTNRLFAHYDAAKANFNCLQAPVPVFRPRAGEFDARLNMWAQPSWLWGLHP